MTIKPSEVLGEARDELYMGWTQGSYRSQGNVCAVAAVERVTMRHLQEDSVPAAARAKRALLEKVRELTSDRFNSIQNFNDFGGTTKEDVLMAMDKAQIGLEEVGE